MKFQVTSFATGAGTIEGCRQKGIQRGRLGVASVLTVTFLLGSAAPSQAQLVFNFDTTAPTTTDELPDFFDVYGFDADFGDDPFWHIDANETNPDDGSNALHTVSDGNQLANYFSRVAIFQESVAFAEDVEISADITWDELGGDATDNAGLYLRFNGDGDEPLDNDYYFVRVGVDNGPPSSVTIYKVQGGFDDQLVQEIDEPFPIAAGDTINLSFGALTTGDGVELTVAIDGELVSGMDPFVDDIDPLLGPGRVGVGQETNPTYFDNITISGPGIGGGGAQLQAGDSDQDLDFDQIDLVAVQIAAKYLTGQPATWGEGDWNGAPGGSQGSPPAGDGQFNQLDIISALGNGLYLSGPYAAVRAGGSSGDGQTSIVYNPGSGELGVDAPAGTDLTSINIDSASGIFTGQAAQNLGGSFDNDGDNNIFKATFGGSFGSLSFGNVAQAGLDQDFVLNDLTVVGSLAGGGALGDVDLIYVPEPAAFSLSGIAIIGVLAIGRRKWLPGLTCP